MGYEIRPMAIGEILDTGFRLLRNHFGLLVSLAAVVYVPVGVLGHVVTAASQADPQVVQANLMPMLLAVAALLVVAAIGFPWIGTALTAALGDLYVGRPTSVGTALGQAWSILLPVVGTSMVAMLFITLGFIALIVPGVWLVLMYWVVSQVMVIERVFGMQALRRSSELMKGNKGRAIVLGLVVGILQAVVSTGATWALSPWPLLNSIASTLVGMIAFAFFYAVGVVFYFDVRCRREAFDLEHLARLVEQRAAPAPAG